MDNLLILSLSEITLSLYPQLIKLVDTNLETQIVFRFITYSILSLIGNIFYNPLSSFFEYSILQYLGLGMINIFHILSSYTAFRILSSGASYTLFYTYPIFNLLGRSLFYKEHINIYNYFYIIIAIIGTYLLTNDQIIKDKKYLVIGFIAGLISAITESLIYLFIKKETHKSPFQEITRFYLLGGLISIAIIIYSHYKEKVILKESFNDFFEMFRLENINIKIEKKQIITLILFNALIGFVGYVLRFFIISRISTLEFNSLIFIGVIFAYIWGFIFSNEKIYIKNIIGTFLIILSIFLINL